MTNNERERSYLETAHICLDDYWIEGNKDLDFPSAYYISNHGLLEGFAKWEQFQRINIPDFPWMFGSLYFEVDRKPHYFLLYKIIGIVGEANGDND